jgi:Flp pilus assembly protein TadG
MINQQGKSVFPASCDRLLARPVALRLGSSSRERGATLVEYAFVVLIFMGILFGISGFGHMLFVYHYLNNAAREATRYAAVRGSTCANDANGGSCAAMNSASGNSGPTTAADIKTYVTSITPSSIETSKLVVPTTGAYFCGVSGSACTPAITSAPASCNTSGTENGPGCTVKVTVAYPYNFIFPLLPTATTITAPCTQPGFCLTSTSQMVIVH